MLTEHDLIKRAQERSDFPVTAVVTTGSAYASGQVLGGLITIDTSATQNGPNLEPWLSNILQSLAVLDPSSLSPAMDLFFFGAKPLAAYVDHATFAPTLADMLGCVGVVQVLNADFLAAGAIGTIAAGAKQANLGRVLKPLDAGSTAIYCIPVVRATPTFTVASLSFRFQFSNGS